MLSGIGVLEDVETFGIGRHDSVLDPVVNHFDEVTGPVGTAMQPAVFRGGLVADASFGRRRGGDAGCERGKSGGRVLHGGFGAADHLAVTPFEAPDAAGHPDVDIVDALFREVLRPTDVVLVVAVATVDDDVALFEVGGDLLERFIDEGDGKHHPGRAGLFKLGNEVFDAGRADRAVGFE